jgi:hypothetical protein
VNLTVEGSSSAWRVMMSSFPAHLSIFERFSMLSPGTLVKVTESDLSVASEGGKT